MKNKEIKVLMASAEISPFAKVGGLADVVGSLPPAMKKIGVDVRLIMPKYGSIDDKKYSLERIYKNIKVPSATNIQTIDIYLGHLPNTDIPVYFIDNKKYFSKKEVYWGNNAERFSFFCLSVIYALSELEFKPDIIHAHDFHSALITNLVKLSTYVYSKSAKTLYTIHNLNYQGKSEPKVLKNANLSISSMESLSKDAKDGDINLMVQGIFNCDLLNTVSPTYAQEITKKEQGGGLHRVIGKNKDKLSGILNGLDTEAFNPATDKDIVKKYSLSNLEGKTKNKLALQKEMNLEVNKDIPLVAMVSRLAWQKGLELIEDNLINNLDMQVVILGTGEKKYEDYLQKLAKKYPEKLAVKIMFSSAMAQRIYAGSDFFLMPSRFEPCGLGQMIAMRYSSLPIVRATGGLKDTVDSSVGFMFKKFSARAFYLAVKRAIDVYYDEPKKFKKMQIKAMKKDFSWDNSAKKYLKLYKNLLK
ncbi:glycogen synthase [Patescibacteria group bacterium]|nr:glycogen synthase [Patescibacteria group bacterium]